MRRVRGLVGKGLQDCGCRLLCALTADHTPTAATPASPRSAAHSGHSPAPPQGPASSRLEPLGLHSKFPIKAVTDTKWGGRAGGRGMPNLTRAGLGAMHPRQGCPETSAEPHRWEEDCSQTKKKKNPEVPCTETQQCLPLHYNFFFLASPQ